jgi:hypothetical protein
MVAVRPWEEHAAVMGYRWAMIADGSGGLAPGWVRIETVELPPDDDKGDSDE